MKAALRWRNPGTGVADEIRIYRGTASLDPQNLPTPLATLAGTATHYDDTTVSDSTTYYYLIGSLFGASEVLSNEITVAVDSTSFLINNCVASWDMDAIVSNQIVDSISGNNLTMSGTENLSNKVRGQAFLYNAFTSFSSGGSIAPLFTDKFTISCFIKPAGNGIYCLISHENVFTLYVSGQRLVLHQRETAVNTSWPTSSQSGLSENGLNHVIVTYNAGAVNMYLNNILHYSETLTHSNFVTSGVITVGERQGSYKFPSGAVMGRLKIFNDVASAADRLALLQERSIFTGS